MPVSLSISYLSLEPLGISMTDGTKAAQSSGTRMSWSGCMVGSTTHESRPSRGHRLRAPAATLVAGRRRRMQQRRYVIIGDGAAGTTAAQELRRHDSRAPMLIVSDDPNPAYFRAALTNYLLGELREDQIWAVPPAFYAEHRI